jgi:RimJ/RimL family protein N-acetyltransferase
VDPDRVVALVVTTPAAGTEKLIGGGRYCSDLALKSAELAFMTDDAYRGRGIAGLVLQHLIRIGREKGILAFEADVLAQNQAMLAVFRRSGLPMKKRAEGNVIHVKLSLALDQTPFPETGS